MILGDQSLEFLITGPMFFLEEIILTYLWVMYRGWVMCGSYKMPHLTTWSLLCSQTNKVCTCEIRIVMGHV